MADPVNVYLNRFLVRQLSEADRTVWRYNCTFDAIPEPEAIFREVGRILWAIKVPGARIGAAIARLKKYSELGNLEFCTELTEIKFLLLRLFSGS